MKKLSKIAPPRSSRALTFVGASLAALAILLASGMAFADDKEVEKTDSISATCPEDEKPRKVQSNSSTVAIHCGDDSDPKSEMNVSGAGDVSFNRYKENYKSSDGKTMTIWKATATATWYKKKLPPLRDAEGNSGN